MGALSAAMSAAGIEQLVGSGHFQPDDDIPYALRTFGAVFVEVGVDAELGLVRLRRVVGRYSVGRVVNPRTARAQMVGGIVWGWGKATLEASHHDRHLGRWISQNLAGVAVPVNADIPSDVDVDFIDEVDEHASPIGGKGIGELGATGVDAAVADAVFHASWPPDPRAADHPGQAARDRLVSDTRSRSRLGGEPSLSPPYRGNGSVRPCAAI